MKIAKLLKTIRYVLLDCVNRTSLVSIMFVEPSWQTGGVSHFGNAAFLSIVNNVYRSQGGPVILHITNVIVVFLLA